jgi:hypothetical protein
LKLKLTKFFNGNIELIYGSNKVILTDKKPFVILTESEYESIPEYKQYLLKNKFVTVTYVKE